MSPFFIFWLLTSVANLRFCNPKLVVNVKTKNGRFIQQHLVADPEKDIVMIEYKLPRGSKTVTLIDFPKNLQVVKTLVLGELERGEKPVHTTCYILKFSPNEFISSDAMSKLRQKNPIAIRIPEEVLDTEFLILEKEVPWENSGVFSGHVHQLCGDADKIYTSESNIKEISQGDASLYRLFLSSTVNISSNASTVPSCSVVRGKFSKCICHYEFCLSWYPCALKYCDDSTQNGEKVSYRCGIKTCGKCRQFQYVVNKHGDCFWETPFQHATFKL